MGYNKNVKITKGGNYMTTLQIILLSVCSLLAIVFIVARTLKGGLLGLVLKIVASFGFVGSAIIGIGTAPVLTDKWPLILITLGFLCGMIGDIVLDLKVIYDNDKWYLNTGMSAFFVGHVFYIIAFSLLAGDTNLLLPLIISAGISIVLSIGTLIGGTKMMKLDFGKFVVPTAGYTFILNMALVYSLYLAIIGAGMWLIFIGLALFLLSDLVLSMQYFGGKIASKPLIAINHTLYYAAQIVLVASLFLI